MSYHEPALFEINIFVVGIQYAVYFVLIHPISKPYSNGMKQKSFLLTRVFNYAYIPVNITSLVKVYLH